MFAYEQASESLERKFVLEKVTYHMLWEKHVPTRVHFGNYKLVFCIHDIESGLIENILEHWIEILYSMKLNKLFKSE